MTAKERLLPLIEQMDKAPLEEAAGLLRALMKQQMGFLSNPCMGC